MALTPGSREMDPGRRHLLVVAPLVALCIVGLSPTSVREVPPHPGDPQAKITVAVDLVLLPVSVTDLRGAAVAGLKREDFRVFEDGQPQQLTVFEESDSPVTVGLIVDHSRSMGGKLREVVAAVSLFVHSSNAQDEMFVVDFNDEATIEPMGGKLFSSDGKELEKALISVSARGRTALYDAVNVGLGHLSYGRWGKKALVIISDGGDNASHLKYPEILARARQSQATIYSIGLVGTDQAEENPGLLRRLTRDTGGIAYFAREGDSLPALAGEIARDLRDQYTLGYSPQSVKTATAFRKIKVQTLNHRSLRVRTRQGYSPAPEKQPTAESGAAAR